MNAPEKLSLIVFSETFEKVHYALVMASAALATDRAVTLFFTMGACRALTGTKAEPGWRDLPAETGDGAAGRGLDRDHDFATKGVGTFDELLQATVELGGKIMVCEMGLRAMGLTRADLRDDLAIEEGGVVTFMNDAGADAQMMFI